MKQWGRRLFVGALLSTMFLLPGNDAEAGIFRNIIHAMIVAGEEEEKSEIIDGLVIVHTGKKRAVLDTAGNVVVPPIYDKIRFDSAGFIHVTDKKQCGVLRADGTVAVPVAYERVGDAKEGRFIVYDKKNDRYGAYDADGRIVVPIEQRELYSYCEGLASVCRSDKTWTFVDLDGRFLPGHYRATGHFSEGLAAVKDDTNRYGYINREGTTVIPCVYAEALPFSDGTAVVRDDTRRYGYIDKTGAQVVPCAYADARDFSGGYAAVLKNHGAIVRPDWGFVDRTGAEVIKPHFYYVDHDFTEDGRAIVSDDRFAYFIDATGTILWPSTYDRMEPYKDGLAAVYNRVGTYSFNAISTMLVGSKWDKIYDDKIYTSIGNDVLKRGYVDAAGKEIISTKNDYVSPFDKNGLSYVMTKGKWGVMDRTGAYVIEPRYERIYPLTEGLFAVRLNDRWGFIDRAGAAIIPPAYDQVVSFGEGAASVCKDGTWHVIDKDGKDILTLPDGVTDLGPFAAGLMPVRVGKLWGYMDHAGAFVVAPAYDAADIFRTKERELLPADEDE